MVEPLNLQEHLKNLYFIPKQVLVVLFGMTNYDAVQNNGEQAYENVAETQEVISELKDYLINFGVEDYDFFVLNDPTEAQTEEKYKTILNIVEEGNAKSPPENTLIFHCFVGQGVEMHGSQYVLFNEFDASRNFYKMFAAEKNIRLMANKFPNLYQVGIFACSRKPFEEAKFTANPNKTPGPGIAQADSLEQAISERTAGNSKSGNNIGTNIARENILLIQGPRDNLQV